MEPQRFRMTFDGGNLMQEGPLFQREPYSTIIVQDYLKFTDRAWHISFLEQESRPCVLSTYVQEYPLTEQ
jgi:hypothetical protein